MTEYECYDAERRVLLGKVIAPNRVVAMLVAAEKCPEVKTIGIRRALRRAATVWWNCFETTTDDFLGVVKAPNMSVGRRIALAQFNPRRVGRITRHK